MTIIVVDDEKIILDGERKVIEACVGDARVLGFSSAEAALQFASENDVDVAFLDIEMADLNGIELAKRLKQHCRNLNIIFATAYNDYYRDAMALHASGYLLKPIRKEQVLAELEDLRYPKRESREGMFVRAFGSFEVFFNEKPLLFRYQKAKELFAYLVDRRGTVVSRDELVTILWGGEETHTNYYKQVQKDLRDTLASVGMENILIKQRGVLGLLMKGYRCDYYDYLQGLPRGLNAYRGEYMRQYDWAEPTWVNLEGKSTLWTQ